MNKCYGKLVWAKTAQIMKKAKENEGMNSYKNK